MRRGLASLIAVLCFIATPALAKTYSDNLDGTVTDPTTGLTWMRCSMGQTWDGSTCTGNPSLYTWDQANALTGTVTFAGHSDWRLPNIRELETLVDRAVTSPAINTTTFPTSEFSPVFWTSTPYSTFAWSVHFYQGTTFGGAWRLTQNAVRLARAGQPLGLLNPARPATDYVHHGDGTVTHTPTGLMWKRCVEGLVWNNGVCDGTSGTYSWDSAKLLPDTFAGKNDWRLPSLDELLTLFDYTAAPGLVANLFQIGSGLVDFWSSSPSADGAWYLNFGTGGVRSQARSVNYKALLVRGGQPSSTFVLNVLATGAPGVEVGSVPSSYGGTANYTKTDIASGTSITLTAPTNIGNAKFSAWTGCDSTSGTACTVTMTANKTVEADYPAATALITLKLIQGWNLVGNGYDATIDVPKVFGDATKISTVWKWVASKSLWAFYAPSLTGQALIDYATGKGYDVLTTISGGEGFWVNTTQAFTKTLPVGLPMCQAPL